MGQWPHKTSLIWVNIDSDNGLSPVRNQATTWTIYDLLSIKLLQSKYKHFRWRKFIWKHDDVIKWKHFPRYWPFVRGIHRSPVNSPHNGQWRGALMFSLICTWIDGWGWWFETLSHPLWRHSNEVGKCRPFCSGLDVLNPFCSVLAVETRETWACAYRGVSVSSIVAMIAWC